MANFKLVFHVEDVPTKEVIVEKSQIYLVLPEFGLERDEMAELVESARGGQAPPANVSAHAIAQSLEGTAETLRRFLRIKLREWAKAKKGST